MSEQGGGDEGELQRLRAQVPARQRDVRDLDAREHSQETLIARLREEAAAREETLSELRGNLETAELELKDLRAIRDALTPPELPERPGLELASAFLPGAAEQVSGDFYLVAEGPQDSTVLVVGDVVGHGLQAARRAALVRTTFTSIAPFSDDPARLLSWANTALIERAGATSEFVTAACVTYLPGERYLRWAYAGHPRALWLDGSGELVAPRQGTPLGIDMDPGAIEGALKSEAGAGLVLYTDGLTEARHEGELFGVERVRGALGELHGTSPGDAVGLLRARVAAFTYGTLADDLCLLGVRIT